jgi:hypothetical protein
LAATSRYQSLYSGGTGLKPPQVIPRWGVRGDVTPGSPSSLRTGGPPTVAAVAADSRWSPITQRSQTGYRLDWRLGDLLVGPAIRLLLAGKTRNSPREAPPRGRDPLLVANSAEISQNICRSASGCRPGWRLCVS